MSEKRFRDVDTGAIVTMDSDTYARNADVKSQKLGGPRYRPVGGKVEVALTDSEGKMHSVEMNADAAHTAFRTKRPGMVAVTDSNRDAIKQLEAAQLEEEAWRGVAREQGAAAFWGHTVPGSRALERLGKTPEQKAHDVKMAQLQDQENPGAAAAGTITGMLSMAAMPIPGLGALRGGAAAKGAAEVAAGAVRGEAAAAGAAAEAAAAGGEVLAAGSESVAAALPSGTTAAQLAGGAALPQLGRGAAGTGLAVRGAPLAAREGMGLATGGTELGAAKAAPEWVQATLGADVGGAQAAQVAQAAQSALGAGTPGARGLLASGVESGVAGDVAAGLFQEEAGRGAMSLLGFADEVGTTIRAGLTNAGVPTLAAKVVGNVGAGALVNAPLSVVFQAAQAVDYDKPLTGEAFARDLGNNLLLGALFDAGIPLGGALARGVGRLAAGGVRSAGTGLLVAGAILPGVAGRVAGRAGYVATKLGSNAARRLAGGAKLTEAQAASAAYGKALDAAVPSRISSKTSAAKLGDALDTLAAHSPKVMEHPLWAAARAGAADMKFVDKNAAQTAAQIAKETDTLVGYLRAPELGKVSFDGASRGLRMDLQSVANRLADDLNVAGADAKLVKELNSMFTSMAGGPAEGVRRLLTFRNRLALDAIKGENPVKQAIAQMAKRHIDDVLTDGKRLGLAAQDMSAIIGATDDAVSAVQALRGHLPRLKSVDDLVDPVELLGGLAFANGKARSALEALSLRNVIGSNDARFIGRSLEAVDTHLQHIAPKLKTAAAVNTIRGLAAQEFKAISPGLGGGKAAATYAKVEAVSNYLTSTKNVIQSTLGSPGRASKTAMTTGVWQYRAMQSLPEKQAAYADLKQQVDTITATNDTLINGISSVGEGLQADPELAGLVSTNAVLRAQYLKAQMPVPPRGLVQYREFKPTPAEMSNVLEIAGALEDPVSVMDTALRGSLRGSALQALRSVYPAMLADMRMQLAEEVLAKPGLYGQLPYRVRISVDTFLGGGFEPSAQPHSLVNFQNRAAQTKAQDQALRGTAAMRAPQQGSDSGSDSLAAF